MKTVSFPPRGKPAPHVITDVAGGSIAEELGIAPGDKLLKISGHKIEDVFDYLYYAEDEKLSLLVEKKNGKKREFDIEKDADGDLGLTFENGLMSPSRSCANRCIFCFIDQLPKGMRESLYFKDDDARLSFLMGNYVTLTNMSDHDIDRIIKYRLSPINISFHTTDPALRCMMMGNRFAGDALKKAERLYRAGIEMNGQIVLCRGINDGEALDKTISDLAKYIPVLKSVSVVPAGLTRHREGLFSLKAFTPDDAADVIRRVKKWQDELYEKKGTHFAHAADEWYVLAGSSVPEDECYDGYPQLENGVGMIRLLGDEFDEALSREKGDLRRMDISVATGYAAYECIAGCVKKARGKFPNVNVRIYKIRNDFFGEQVTVAGLITGGDLISQLKGKELGEKLLIPSVMLKRDENIFLDDVTIDKVREALQTEVRVVESGGQSLLFSILGKEA